MVWVGVRRRWPLYLVHVEASLVHQHGRILMVWALRPHRRIVEEADVWITLSRALKVILFGGKDLGPPIVECILFGLELLLLLF